MGPTKRRSLERLGLLSFAEAVTTVMAGDCPIESLHDRARKTELRYRVGPPDSVEGWWRVDGARCQSAFAVQIPMGILQQSRCGDCPAES